jgi:hypothetical protein
VRLRRSYAPQTVTTGCCPGQRFSQRLGALAVFLLTYIARSCPAISSRNTRCRTKGDVYDASWSRLRAKRQGKCNQAAVHIKRHEVFSDGNHPKHYFSGECILGASSFKRDSSIFMALLSHFLSSHNICFATVICLTPVNSAGLIYLRSEF